MTKKTSLPRSVQRLFPNVKTVVDAERSIELSVNKKDCNEATKLDPTNCALARAAKRELHADAAIIGMSTSYIIKDDEAIRFKTPESVQREIVSFDRHHDFAPGDYYLKPPSEGARLGTYTYKSGGGKNKSAKRKIHHLVRVRVLPRGSDHK